MGGAVEEPLIRRSEFEQARTTSGIPGLGVFCVVLVLVFIYCLFFVIFLLFGFHNGSTHKTTRAGTP